MRNASDWASGPPAKSFIILKCMTCCVSNPSIAAWPVIFIQFLNNMFLRVTLWCRKDNLSQRCLFRAGERDAPIERGWVVAERRTAVFRVVHPSWTRAVTVARARIDARCRRSATIQAATTNVEDKAITHNEQRFRAEWMLSSMRRPTD